MGIETGVRVGKYEVGRQLGKGGFGIVHFARDTELGRDVAIKILRPEHAFKPSVVQRFLQEARAAARINHPGIVTVFETGIIGGTNTRADGTVYIAMELLAGVTLASRLRDVARMPPALAINYTRQLAAALGAAHQAGIVHRDLKPANVFLVPDAAVVGGERIKVLDFGIAKLVDDWGGNVQTHSMQMLGTPMYMSPEQCKSSAKVDARSDIYALGCILFEMLCGRPPFDGDSGELIAKHQLVPPPTPRSLRGEVPEALDRLVASMLAKSPDDRPQTMSAVEDALTEIGDARGDSSDDTRTHVHVAPAASRLRGRLPLIAGASGIIAIGVVVGVLSRGHHDDRATAAKVEPAPSQTPAPSPAPPSPTPPPVVAADVPAVDAAVADAGPVAKPDSLALECQEAVADKRWDDLAACAKKLAPGDPDEADRFAQTAATEKAAMATLAKLRAAVDKRDRKRAKKLLEDVPGESVYRGDAEAVFADLDVSEPKTTPTNRECDADALKDKGMESVNMGQHAAALAQFEASLRCKPDSYVLSLAFMAACNSQNTAKARQYYVKLRASEKEKLDIMCVRNHVESH